MFIAVLVGFIAMVFLGGIPIVGPILAGMIAGLLAKGVQRGMVAGFLSGIVGAILLAILISSGFTFFGILGRLPILGLLGGAIGMVIIIASLYAGLLGLVGGAIGGKIRKE